MIVQLLLQTTILADDGGRRPHVVCVSLDEDVLRAASAILAQCRIDQYAQMLRDTLQRLRGCRSVYVSSVAERLVQAASAHPAPERNQSAQSDRQATASGNSLGWGMATTDASGSASKPAARKGQNRGAELISASVAQVVQELVDLCHSRQLSYYTACAALAYAEQALKQVGLLEPAPELAPGESLGAR